MAILIAAILAISMAVSLATVQKASAHTPIWDIPTYAYIVAAPNPIGVGQTLDVYMWLDPEYGAAGGATEAVPGNASTASAALLENDYRFQGYEYVVTAPDGKSTTTTFATTADPTSDQYFAFTPTQVGTYTIEFIFPGQTYGAKNALYPQGDGYQGSTLYGDYYEPSNSTVQLVVQSTPIPAPQGSSPLPTAFWTRPIFGENTNWYTIASNWLGTGSPYASSSDSSPAMSLFHPDGAGSLTSHIMWTQPMDSGGVVGGIFGTDSDQTAVLDSTNLGVSYFDGSAYDPRFQNPIIVDGMLIWDEPIGYTAPNNGPVVCENLETGQIIWQHYMPFPSFAYVYNLWDQDQHGTFDPILFTSGFAEAFDAYTGDMLFNVTGVPSGTSVLGPEGETLHYIMTNDGPNPSYPASHNPAENTAANYPDWYLSEWNSSKLWQYDINVDSGAGSLVASLVNATNGAIIPGQVGTTQPSAAYLSSSTVSIYNYPPSQALIVQGNVPINGVTSPVAGDGLAGFGNNPVTFILNSTAYPRLTTYDWNISIAWHNLYGSNTWNSTYGPNATPSIIAAAYDQGMLLRAGGLSSGFAATGTGDTNAYGSYLPYTYFYVDLNTSHTDFGQIVWSKTYNPPSGNLSMSQGCVDFQSMVFYLTSSELRNWYAFSLVNGAPLWISPSQGAFDYYGNEGTVTLPGQAAYGNLYCSSFSGVLYCYNAQTGAIEWTFGNGPIGSNNSTKTSSTFYGDYPTMIQAISNDVVYEVAAEHTVTDPIYKGAMARAINATDGVQIWSLLTYDDEFGSMGYALADGYNVWDNSYDEQIYCVGRGPTQLTVEAPQTAITAGVPVVIQGRVSDISPGTKQTQEALDFPNGVPVAADSIMQQWMAYVYQQQPMPTNFVGVPVTITAIDPNHNFVTLGTVNTTSTGLFTLTWTPPTVPGEYLLTATFGGTLSYWGSNAQTGMVVQNAPATAAPYPTPVTGLASFASLEYGVVAVIIVVIIIGAILALIMLRKRP